MRVNRRSLLPRFQLFARRRNGLAPRRLFDRNHHRQARCELRQAGVDHQLRLIHAAKFFGTRVYMDQRLRRHRCVEQRIARGRHLAQPRPDRENQIRILDALCKFRVDADAHVAYVVRMAVIEKILITKRARDRQVVCLREAFEVVARGRCPAKSAKNHDRPVCAAEQAA